MIRIISLCLALVMVAGCTYTPDRFVTVEESLNQPVVGVTFSLQPSGEDASPTNVSRLRTMLLDAGMVETAPEKADIIVTHWLTTTRREPTVEEPVPMPAVAIDPASGTPVLHMQEAMAPQAIEYAVLSVAMVDGNQWRQGRGDVVYEAHAASALAREESKADDAAYRLIKAMFKDFPAQEEARTIVSSGGTGQGNDDTNNTTGTGH